jgi:ribosomal protein S12 methylthiotransferase
VVTRVKPRYSKNNQPKTKLIFIESLGCSKNLVKSELIASILSKNGYSFSTNQDVPKSSDLVIINTCGFIKAARDEAEQVIKKYNSLLTSVPVLIIGCYASRFSLELQRKFPGCIIIDSIDPLEGLKKYLNLNNKTFLTRKLSTCHFAYLEISAGCNKSCSYCLIPSIQGFLKSKTKPSLLKEVQALVEENSIKELVLIAQDTASYGSDLSPKESLLSLIKTLSEIKDIRWIRIMYLYPTLPIVELTKILECEKVVPYLDIPLQHFSPRILKQMNRPSNINPYLKKLFEYKEKHPLLTLRSTFMVGFPGETEEDFNLLLQGLKQYRFDRAGFFAYSRENETMAYSLPEQVHASTKKRRLKLAYSVQEEISLLENQKWISKTLPVLLEKYNPEGHYALGRTYREAPEIDPEVFISGNPFHLKKKIGTIQNMKITEASAYEIRGSLQE